MYVKQNIKLMKYNILIYVKQRLMKYDATV